MDKFEHVQHTRSRTALALGAALALLIGAFFVGFLTPRRSEPHVALSPVAEIVPAATPLNEFASRCEKGFDDWRSAQVVYPKTLKLAAGMPGTYVAAIDVRDVPLPAAELIPGSDPQAASIGVRCVVSARVVSDQSMVVDPAGWTPRQFNPAGVMNWSWSITGNATGTRELRLELQPAVAASDNSRLVFAGSSPEQTLTFLTTATLRDPPQPPTPKSRTFWQWAGDNWGTITTVAGGAAVVVLASIKYISDLGTALQGLRKAWRKPRKTMTSRRQNRKASRADSNL